MIETIWLHFETKSIKTETRFVKASWDFSLSFMRRAPSIRKRTSTIKPFNFFYLIKLNYLSVLSFSHVNIFNKNRKYYHFYWDAKEETS